MYIRRRKPARPASRFEGRLEVRVVRSVPVDAGEPGAVAQPVGIEVVHLGTAPPGAGRRQDRRFVLLLAVASPAELRAWLQGLDKVRQIVSDRLYTELTQEECLSGPPRADEMQGAGGPGADPRFSGVARDARSYRTRKVAAQRATSAAGACWPPFILRRRTAAPRRCFFPL